MPNDEYNKYDNNTNINDEKCVTDKSLDETNDVKCVNIPIHNNADDMSLNIETAVTDMSQLNQFYTKNRNNVKFAHLNINSIRHKFAPLADYLQKSVIDVLFVQETKLDDSFPFGQFQIPYFVLHRKDVRQDCGGLFAQVRSDIPHTRRNDMEEYIVSSGRIECMVIELVLKS